jgi:hypothetical protein
MTFLFGSLPCLDIQVQFDKSFCIKENRSHCIHSRR